MYEFDPHIHCIASGHGTRDTITDIAKWAKSKGLKMIGLTDHGPATTNAAGVSYFRNLKTAPQKRCGITILYGVELNILDNDGSVDLEDAILETLDYAVISMHTANRKPGTAAENTFAYVNAMKHPKVKILGHCDDVNFPVDYEALLIAAKHYGVVFEINNASLSPNGYRGDTRRNIETILELCQKNQYPVVLSSDSHGRKDVGNFTYACQILEKMNFPKDLVMNHSASDFYAFIRN